MSFFIWCFRCPLVYFLISCGCLSPGQDKASQTPGRRPAFQTLAGGGGAGGHLAVGVTPKWLQERQLLPGGPGAQGGGFPDLETTSLTLTLTGWH